MQSELCDKLIAKDHARQQRKRGQAVPKTLEVGQWVLVKPSQSFPMHKLAPRWLGPFEIHQCSADSEIVVVRDTLKDKLRKFFKRQLELFDASALPNVEGLKTVAETDAFQFPVESICGHALINSGGVGASPEQLPSTFRRGPRGKKLFQFLIKWTGYEEPTWVDYKTASRLVQFPGYVSFLPGLNMS